MNFLEKVGLLWTIYWFVQNAMHLTVYYTINSLGAVYNANDAIVFAIPGIILFLLGTNDNLAKIRSMITNKNMIDNRICQKCGYENDMDSDFCPNCGIRLLN